jgi:hypothetical protein
MVNGQDRVTRVTADLVDAATAEDERQSRSSQQQLDHWTRLGRAASQSESAARRRVEAALAGTLPTHELTAEEGLVFNAEISAALDKDLAGIHYGHILAAESVTTVALDETGQIRQYRPDGTDALLPPTT